MKNKNALTSSIIGLRFAFTTAVACCIAVCVLPITVGADDSDSKTTVSESTGSEIVAGELSVLPAKVLLSGQFSQQQLLIDSSRSERVYDLTRAAKYESKNPDIVAVDEAGLLTAVSNGQTQVVVTVGGKAVEHSVVVEKMETPLSIDFRRDVMPVLSRGACNSGPCHGKARGQNGFQLSLLGFDPKFDFDSLVKEGRGRRVFPPFPEQSLILQKTAGVTPHGGGIRLKQDSYGYEVLKRWIETGTPESQPNTPELTKVSVWPTERVLDHEAEQQIMVTAHYNDGSTRDITRMADYLSNESGIVAVDEEGLAKSSTVVGEAAIMARYEGLFAICRIAVPLPGEVPEQLYADLPQNNFIDGHIWTKLQRLGLTPSEPADDATYLRRAYIDVIGRPPTSSEARAFLIDETASAAKREALIDDLLQRPEYADFWANKWVDLLRPNPYRVGIKAVFNYDNWIRSAFRKNRPYNEFVYDLVTASGSTFREGAITLYRDRRAPDEITTMVSQLFLGIRLDCARCHHHPFEVWGQDDFYGFAAYFAQIGRKGTGLSPPISGSEEFVFNGGSGSVRHPLTGAVVEPKPLFGEAPSLENGRDRRIAVAEWITSTENSFFEQTMANRVWADLMGRGLVEPVDDIRATNPASNPELMAALGKDFREQGYDVKKLIRRICGSYVYGLSSNPSDRNSVDTRNYSRFYRQRLRAEVMLDAAVSITGVPEKFRAMPPNTRASEIWTHRISSLFLDAFGRPDLNQDPPCERTTDTSVVQVLHLMNAENLAAKVTSEKGRVTELTKKELTSAQIVEELYLSVYSRFPSEDETKLGVQLFEQKDAKRREVIEDLLWALLNTPEFVFKK